MKRIDVVGRGNVGWHLMKAIEGKADINSVDSRTLAGLRSDCDICILAVPDDKIPDISAEVSKLISADTTLVHTSGSVSVSVIAHEKKGVIYPLQTFTKEKELNYESIPVMVEGNDTELLIEVAALFSKKIYRLDSESRRKLHLASVISSNLANRLWTLADDYLKTIDIPAINISLLQPLLSETTEKLSALTPRDAQTGPAARGDFGTIRKHCEMLQDNPELLSVYELLTNSILSERTKKPKP